MQGIPEEPYLNEPRAGGGGESEGPPAPGITRRAPRAALGGLRIAAQTALALSALGPFLRLDSVAPGMILTYVPRWPLAVLALALAAASLCRRRVAGSVIFAVAGLGLLLAAGLGSSFARVDKPPGASSFGLLAFNVEDAKKHAQQIADLARSLRADFICLQEVGGSARAEFARALGDYELFWGDDGHPEQPYEEPARRLFSCMTGVRRELIGSRDDVQLFGALTGYRTHGIRVKLGGRELWLVNVHTTKPPWFGARWLDYVKKSRWKAAWHRAEHDLLAQWAAAREESPVVLAGDFNSPCLTYNTRFEGFTNAHFAAGSGLQLSFPRRFPIIGIDQVLGNAHVAFEEYRSIDAGFSDHRAQFCRFSLAEAR